MSSGVAAEARAIMSRTAGSWRSISARSASLRTWTWSSRASSISVESNRLPRLSGAICGWSGSTMAAPITVAVALVGEDGERVDRSARALQSGDEPSRRRRGGSGGRRAANGPAHRGVPSRRRPRCGSRSGTRPRTPRGRRAIAARLICTDSGGPSVAAHRDLLDGRPVDERPDHRRRERSAAGLGLVALADRGQQAHLGAQHRVGRSPERRSAARGGQTCWPAARHRPADRRSRTGSGSRSWSPWACRGRAHSPRRGGNRRGPPGARSRLRLARPPASTSPSSAATVASSVARPRSSLAR